ncbi:hypothetical protein AFL01nite_14390 [Aeromicrobium flavum]|uniref:Uncharacterized protein n=1 Tax=Aeromicrobium flavum TaxID=416568 RepID=A0A512HUH9_9ACTN|nr:hypothetical protein AFL01nite_14390 [Aeromicrobium flavum]
MGDTETAQPTLVLDVRWPTHEGTISFETLTEVGARLTVDRLDPADGLGTVHGCGVDPAGTTWNFLVDRTSFYVESLRPPVLTLNDRPEGDSRCSGSG